MAFLTFAFWFCLLPFALLGVIVSAGASSRVKAKRQNKGRPKMSDTLVGTVKGPGEKPSEFVFITTDNDHTRVGEFVYYVRSAARNERTILGNVTERRLARSLPDSFLADPETPPASVAAMIGFDDDGAELFEIVVSVIGYYDDELMDFVNPRIPPMPGQPVYLAPSALLAKVLSPKQQGERGAAHI